MATTKLATLITTDQITKEFITIHNQLDKFDAISKSVNIQDDETLAIAENNAAQIKELLTLTDAARKKVGDPYYKTHKAVNEYAKGITDRIKSFKERFGHNITSYRKVQEAAARAHLDSKRKDLEAEEELKTIEAAKIVRLTRTIYAKLYGGTFMTKAGEEKVASGCHTQEDCIELAGILNTSLPDDESYIYFPEKGSKIRLEAGKFIRKHQIDLMELASDIPGKRIAATDRINQNRVNAGMAAVKTQETLTKNIATATRKEVKAGEADIKEAAKGTRKILKFRIDNPEQVLREYLSVDDVKIRAWMEGQNDLIKENLQKNVQPLPGIQFYVEEIYAAR